MRAALFVGFVAIVSQAGCAARASIDTNKLNQRIEELAQQESALQRQLEEVQNRLFLLEDKVDTSRVAIERRKPPRLPVVRLRPQPSERGAAIESQARRHGENVEEDEGSGGAAHDDPSGYPRSVVGQSAVVYEGEAGRGGQRPVLRLHESSGGAGAGQLSSGRLLGPDPADVDEKLPVVPIPPRGKAAAAVSAAPTVPKDRDLRPMQAYQRALGRYRSGAYAAAADAFRKFIRHYARHAYADNALYWLAECSYDLKNYRLALKFFRQVVEQYPGGNKAPDALLKMAFCYVKLKDKKNARSLLGQVVESYPQTRVAKLAHQAMAKL
jgi:tol-pal system protein YbgF